MALIVQLHEGVAINKYPLDEPKLTIGRSPENEIYIDDSVGSSKHALIERLENVESDQRPDFFIEDLDSTNSTFVNGKKITRQKLQHEDVFRVGFASFKFIDETKADPEQTAKIHKSWIPGVYYTKK